MDLRELALTKSMDSEHHPWELARLDIVEFLLRRCGVTGPAARHIVDFGCGDAFVASALTDRLNSMHGSAVDRAFSPETIARITPTLSPRVSLFDSLETLQTSGRPQASLVLLLDVLEHCEDDRGTLAAIVGSPVAAADVHFLLTVPAFQGLFSKHDRFLGHHRRYARGELYQLAQDCGLEPIDSGYFFSSLLAPRVLQVMLERLGLGSEVVQGVGNHQGAPWSNALIRSILWTDFRLCEGLARAGIRLPGLSCFVLARKHGGVQFRGSPTGL